MEHKPEIWKPRDDRGMTRDASRENVPVGEHTQKAPACPFHYPQRVPKGWLQALNRYSSRIHNCQFIDIKLTFSVNYIHKMTFLGIPKTDNICQN